ncbi:MAG: ATP-binding protein [Nitrospirota bacterium]
MDGSLLLYSVILLLIVLVSFYLMGTFMKFLKEKKRIDQKDLSKVNFVVDTFRELVAKLKEKEKELDILRQKAEDRATAIEDYNENILQSVPSGVISFDEDMRITKVNHAAEKILEIKREMILGKNHDHVLDKPITNLLNERRFIERGEISYTTVSGKRIWLGLTLSPLKDSFGNTIGQILVFTDLTHLKAIESQVMLRDKLSSLGEISAGIAHELRNPMGVIAGYTKLLSRKVDNSLKPTVDAILKEILVMDRIISDFLSFARMTELSLSDVDIRKILKSSLTSVVSKRKDIRLNLNIDELPTIKGDEIFLRQAFINLIQNSVEAMPQGGELTIKGSALSYEGGNVNVSISDTGHGISEDIRDKIFLPFFTTKEKGTGLGLAIVHKIIVSHGGTISVISSGKGTTFDIRLPLEFHKPV